MFHPLSKFKFYHRLDSHNRELLRGASTAFVIKVLAAGLAFIFNVVLARLLGAEGAGLYFLAFTVITIASTLGRVGMDNTMIRFVAANAVVQNWIAVKGVYSKVLWFAFISSSVLAVLIFILAPCLANSAFSEPELMVPLRWMALAIVPFALLTLHAQALMGLKCIRDAILVLSVYVPLLSLFGCVFLVPLWGVSGAVWAYIIAAVITLLIGVWRWQRATTPHLQKVVGHFETKTLLESSIPLFWVAVFTLVINQSSILMLGLWEGSEAVGIFSVAIRTATLISFVLIAVNSIAAPKFAASYKQNDMLALEQIAKNSAKLTTLIATPPLLLCLFVPDLIMQIFGEQFVKGAFVLSILAVGEFINVASGSVGYLLMMTGNERLYRNTLIVCAILNLILNFLLIPYAGIIGAAIATAVTLALQNLIAVVLVWNKLGIMTLPIPVKVRIE